MAKKKTTAATNGALTELQATETAKKSAPQKPAAKKKAAKAAQKKSAPKKAAASTPSKPAKQASTKKPAAKQPAKAAAAVGSFDHEQIGHTAGAVWSLLFERGELSLVAVKKEIDAPADVVLAAIGWLAREGKLDFSATGRNVLLSLS